MLKKLRSRIGIDKNAHPRKCCIETSDVVASVSIDFAAAIACIDIQVVFDIGRGGVCSSRSRSSRSPHLIIVDSNTEKFSKSLLQIFIFCATKIDLNIIFLKMGQTWSLFVYFCSFLT